MRKLEGVCRFCKHVDSNVYGERCSKAYYRNHGGGYGESWESNKCLHDQNQTQLKSLFEPVGEQSILQTTNEIIELRGSILNLESENQKLRSLIK